MSFNNQGERYGAKEPKDLNEGSFEIRYSVIIFLTIEAIFYLFILLLVDFQKSLNILFLPLGLAVHLGSVCYVFGNIISKDRYKGIYQRMYEKSKHLFARPGLTRYVVKDNTSKNLYYEITSRLLSSVVKADKEEMVTEMEEVAVFIKDETVNFGYGMKQFKNHLKKFWAVEDLAFAAYWYCPDKREAIIKEMLHVAYADGDFSYEERELIKYVAYHMYLTEEVYELVLKHFIYKPRYDKENLKSEDAPKGYWYRDKNGRKHWYAYDDEKKESSKESEGQDQTTIAQTLELQKAYSVLGITDKSTKAEIRATKRNLMRLNHPDLVATKGKEAVNAATLKCQKINEAFMVLRKYGKC